MRKAFLTGITGQDGSYLAELLLSKGFEVHSLIRRASTFNTKRIDHILQDEHESGVRLFTHYGDLETGGQLTDLLYDIKPDYIFNLGAQSHVRVSFDMPEYTSDIVGLGVTRLLEATRRAKLRCRIYQASSSEQFGNMPPLQSEKTSFAPRSPYACSKVYAHNMCVNYREAYDMFISCGILFNHESPRRMETAVTRKITMAVARILKGQQKHLYLGNLEAKRDWGYAPDYVEAMLMMLEQDLPDDYVVGTGESYSVKDFLDEAFGYVNLDWHDYVKFDERYLRPTEVDFLQADAKKAKNKLRWQPKTTFQELVKIMVDADIKELERYNGTSSIKSD